jgi:hypothetical protein
MIRYLANRAFLENEINKRVTTWLRRAAGRTKKFVKKKRYTEKKGIWSEVKPVYMIAQHEKCAYCERKLASEDFGGTIEHDLEHFRPKNSVEQWPTPAISAERGLAYSFTTGNAYTSKALQLFQEARDFLRSLLAKSDPKCLRASDSENR